jgi:hypothetical protein
VSQDLAEEERALEVLKTDVRRLTKDTVHACLEEELFEPLLHLVNGLEALSVQFKHEVGRGRRLPHAKEETFTFLTWEQQEGSKIGVYEVAYKATNPPDKWISASNILRENNAAINDRYHGEGYVFSYWLYGQDKIYRQKLKEGM